VFVASAEDSTPLDCETAPPLPSLAIRTGPLSFEAPTCAAEESPIPSCPISLDWPSACPAGPDEQPHLEEACCCVAVCVTGAVLEALASDETSLDCVTDPSLPSLPTLTGWFTLDGWICSALDAAAAPCSTELS